MLKGKMWLQYYVLLMSLCCFALRQIHGVLHNNTVISVIWCTVSDGEQNKCEAFSRAVDREIGTFGFNYFSIRCKQAFNKEECMALLDRMNAQTTTLDTGEVFIIARYHNLIPKEICENSSLPDVNNLYDLRVKNSCDAGAGILAVWVVNSLMRYGGMEVIYCNNHVKSTFKFFPSCAVDLLIDINNPFVL